jgi:predicted RND superfamily exporter protein
VFTPLCKFFYLLQRRPAWLFAAALVATLLALVPLRHFAVRASAAELLPPDWESVQAWKDFGQKFGSAGHLAVVVHSDDPARNAALVEGLARALRKHPGVNFLEYRAEADFYRKHKMLYISLEDLREVERRMESNFWLSRPPRNPLITDLLNEDERGAAHGAATARPERTSTGFDAEGFEDLEAKYFGRLKSLIGSTDSTTLALRIYPAFDVSDVHACRAFLLDVESAARAAVASTASAQPFKDGSAPEVLYTGEVVRTIQNEGKLFSRVLGTTRLALYLSAALLLLNFLRFAGGAFLALIPVSMAVVWTAALTQLWLGPLGIVSAPLSLLLIGLGLSGAVHLLARYAEERRKAVGPETAFETITLETGPALAAGLLTLALAFLTFRATGFRALADFGLVAGIGMVCTVIAVLAVFPGLLRLVEPTGLLNPGGGRLYNAAAREGAFRPFRHARLFVVVAVVLTALLLRHGPQWRFLHDFDALGFHQDPSARADSLLIAASEELSTPAVFLAPDGATALRIAQELRRNQERLNATAALTGEPGSAIGNVTTLRDLLPARQAQKLEITARLRRTITPAVIARAREPMRTSLIDLTATWPDRPLTVADLPETYRRKFTGPDSSPGVFVYAFPARDARGESNLLRFAREVRTVTLPVDDSLATAGSVDTSRTPGTSRATQRKTWQAGGWPVVYGDLVARMLPDARKAVLYGITAIFLVLWLTIGSFRGAVFLLLPVLATLFWTLGCIKWLGIKINPYNLIAFPVALAYATLHALLFQHRYEEEGRGSLPLVLRRTGRSALVATVIAAAAFIPMAFSDHYGLHSLGVTALIGLACSLASTLLLMGGLFGIWEARKAGKAGKK